MSHSLFFQNPSNRTQWASCGFALFWVAVAFFSVWGIWGGSLDSWDEALTAERSREMFHQGWSLTVHKFGIPDFNKPPLYYWMVVAGFSLFGLGEFAVRLPSALMGLACMIVVYRLAKNYGADTAGGLLAVFLLAVTPQWFNISREGLLDSGLTLSMLLALWAYAFHPRSLQGAILAGTALAFGCWLKNPSVLLVLPAMFVHSRMQERPQYWRLLVVLLVACTLGSVWYVHQYLAWGDKFTTFYFDYNIAKRFSQDFEGHRSAWSTYFGYLFKRSPHILVLASAAFFAFILKKYRPNQGAIVQAFFVLTWMCALHLMHSKRAPYLVPMYPFMAILGGHFLTYISHEYNKCKQMRIIIRVFVISSLIFFVDKYEFKMDNNKNLMKAIAFTAENCTNSTIFTLNIPRHVVCFYLDSIVEEVDLTASNNNQGISYIIFKSENNTQLPDILSKSTRVWSNDKNYSVWRMHDGLQNF